MPPLRSLSASVRDDLFPTISRKQFVPFGILFIACFISAYVGAYLYTNANTFPGLIWPPAGIAIAGLYLGGRRLWPAVSLGVLLADVASGTFLFTSILLAVGPTVQALLGAWILDWLGFNVLISRLKDAIAISAVAFIPTLITPTIAVLTKIGVTHTASFAEFSTLWGPYWMGHLFSVIVLVPVIIRWFSRPLVHRTRAELTEIGFAFALLATIDALLFWTPFTVIGGVSLAYLILVPFFWIALRIGPRFMTVAITLNAVLAVLGTLLSDRIPPGQLGHALFQIEIFVAIISFIFLVLVAVIEERKDTSKALTREVDKLGKALSQIKRADAAKNEFIAILAHELRNPLAPIVSSLELLELEDCPPSARKWQNVIRDHTTTMRRLLDDLLDISRVSQRKLRLAKESLDLTEATAHAIQTAEPLFRTKQHVVSFAPGGPLVVEADPVRIEQVLVNLLNNASRYTEPGGTIHVRSESERGEAVVSVKDSGIGIAPHMLSRIFEPFVQAGSEKQGFAGLGIGLSLTRELIDMHGGTIEATSEGLGHGSQFIMRLPLARAPARKEKSFISPYIAPMTDQYRILIIDDNEAAAEGLGRLLEYRGHTTQAIYQGGQALAAVESFQPDVIILDIGLPDIDGYEVARRLRNEVGSKALLIALTGYGQDEDRQQARDAGFDHHLTKPVGLRDIEAVLLLKSKNPAS